MKRWISILTMLAVVHGVQASEPEAASMPDAAKPDAAALTAIDPVFDCYHANSAWGYTLAGKVIDGDGKIWSYGKRGKAWLPSPIKEADATYLTTTDLQSKFAERTSIGQVDAKALADNAALIAKAGEGKIESMDGGARDAGSSSCHAYIRDAGKHDAATQRYRDIELGTDGGVSDTRIRNAAPEAESLLTWLRSVGVAK